MIYCLCLMDDRAWWADMIGFVDTSKYWERPPPEAEKRLAKEAQEAKERALKRLRMSSIRGLENTFKETAEEIRARENWNRYLRKEYRAARKELAAIPVYQDTHRCHQ